MKMWKWIRFYKWNKMIVMLCLGSAIGFAWSQFDKGNVAAGIGFTFAAICALGWRIECSFANRFRCDSDGWEDYAHHIEFENTLNEGVLDMIDKSWADAVKADEDKSKESPCEQL